MAAGRAVAEFAALWRCMAMGWLDLVRFADTIGYHSDNPATSGPIAITSSAPSTTTSPSTSSPLSSWPATFSLDRPKGAEGESPGFNMLLLTTEEGGAQARDYEVRMLTDRVRAVGTVWVGRDVRVLPVSRSQVRPCRGEGLLFAGSLLRRHQGADHRPARSGHVVGRRQANRVGGWFKQVEELQKQAAGKKPEPAELVVAAEEGAGRLPRPTCLCLAGVGVWSGRARYAFCLRGNWMDQSGPVIVSPRPC